MTSSQSATTKSRPSPHDTVSRTPSRLVIRSRPGSAAEGVVPGPADETVGAVPARQAVGSTPAPREIGACPKNYRIVSSPAVRDFGRAHEEIGASCAYEDVSDGARRCRGCLGFAGQLSPHDHGIGRHHHPLDHRHAGRQSAARLHSFGQPGARSIKRGRTTSYAITVGSVQGFTGTFSLSLDGLPPGATSSFTPSSVVAPGSSTLAATTSSSAPRGTYTLTIRGTSGATSHAVAASLTIK